MWPIVIPPNSWHHLTQPVASNTHRGFPFYMVFHSPAFLIKVTPVFSQSTSMESLRAALRAEDVQYVVRVADDGGVLRLVVVKEKVEISGAVCTTAYVESFGMWYSLILGRLTDVDIALLTREHPRFLWFYWVDVVKYLRSRLETIATPDLNLLIGELLGHIPSPLVAEEVRSLLSSPGGNPYYLLDLLNGDRQPLSGGRALLGCLWFRCGVYRWVAAMNGKHPVWSGAVTSECLPEASPFTQKGWIVVSLTHKSYFDQPWDCATRSIRPSFLHPPTPLRQLRLYKYRPKKRRCLSLKCFIKL